MAIEIVELMHECFVKLDKKTDEVGKKRGVSMERSKAGTIKEVPTAYRYLIKIQS